MTENNAPPPARDVVALLSKILIVLFVINLISVLFVDITMYFQENGSLAGIRLWLWDSNIAGDMGDRNGLGYAKLASAIAGIISAFTFSILLPALRRRWIEKKKARLVTLVYLSAIYFTLSRFLEVFYIISQSDLRGLVYSVGQFFIPLDVLATACYMVFAYDIFLTNGPGISKNPTKIILGIGYVAAFIGILNTLDVYLDASLALVLGIISYIAWLIIFIFLIRIIAAIFYLRTRVEERKKALLVIGLQLLTMGILLALMILSMQFGGDLLALSYIIRAIKNGLFIFLAWQYIPAIIRPE
jgi:hypothetical protein